MLRYTISEGIMKNIIKNIALLFSSILFGFIILEIVLRFYNPLTTRIRGDEILLPVYHNYVIENKDTDKLDNPIIYTRNSIGFRGEEPPHNLSEYLSIITIGGSTTECLYLSDDKTWSYLLERKLKKDFSPLWLNNAGLDGHSTFGHMILLRDYVVELKPTIALFLFGINDIGSTKCPIFEKDDDIKDILARKSEVASLLLNIYRIVKAKSKELGHTIVNLHEKETIDFPEEEIQKELTRHEKEYIKSYEARLLKIIDICRKNNIDPVFVTQPYLLGDVVDEYTGIYLGNIKAGQYNGIFYWRILDLYNRTTQRIAKENGVFVIDLANELPKNSEYFYDYMHYSNKGAEKISEILYVELKKYMKDKYKDFSLND